MIWLVIPAMLDIALVMMGVEVRELRNWGWAPSEAALICAEIQNMCKNHRRHSTVEKLWTDIILGAAFLQWQDWLRVLLSGVLLQICWTETRSWWPRSPGLPPSEQRWPVHWSPVFAETSPAAQRPALAVGKLLEAGTSSVHLCAAGAGPSSGL